MQTYEIIVSGRAVHANSADTTLVRTSIGIDKIHVLFDNEEWTAFPVRVTFANGDTIISTSLTLAEIDAPEWAAEAECAIPWEVIQDLGGIRITFQGTDASGNHIITEASGTPLTVVEAGDVGSGTVPSPAPSVDEWNQAYANAMAAANSALSASESATEAADRANTAAADAEQVLEDGIPLMDADTRGGAKLGDGLEVDENEALKLSTMSATQHGGATLGSGLTVDDGALSLGDLVQSGSGAEVATDGCAIYSVDGEGWATQDGTPTPDNPVEIEVARGRNLLDLGAVYQVACNATTLKIETTTTGKTWVAKVKPHETYTLTKSGGNRCYIYSMQNAVPVVGDSIALLAGYGNMGTGGTFEAGDTEYIALYLNNSTSESVEWAQLELGTTPTPYVPYGCVGLEVQGKNLLDVAQLVMGGVDSNGNLTTSTTNYVRTPKIPVEPSTEYVVHTGYAENRQILICEWASDGTYSGISSYSKTGSATTASFATKTDTAQVVILFRHVSTPAIPADFSESQLELGTTPTDYQPYHHTITPIPLPLKSDGERWAGGLPDGTADALTVDSAGRWEWVNESDETMFDGSSDEDWTSITAGGRVAISMPTIKRNADANSVIGILSSHYIEKTMNGTYSQVGISSNNTTSQIVIRPSDSTTALADWKTWLSTNPVTVLYPLATPTTEHGYIEDMPALPKGAVVSCPELDEIGCSWFVDGCEALVQHAANMARRETEENESIEDALAELAARVAALES